jgi:hypothetical protein
VIARVLYTEADVANREAAAANLRDNVIPDLRQQHGFVSAYWTTDESGNGLSIILWKDAESEAANEARVGPTREARMAENGVRLVKHETRQVIAHS